MAGQAREVGRGRMENGVVQGVRRIDGQMMNGFQAAVQAIC